jgi:hypothetical protein
MQHLAGAPLHFCGCAPGKRQQQNPLRIDTGDNQVRDTMRQRIGLPRAGAGDHQQWPALPSCRVDAVFNR